MVPTYDLLEERPVDDAINIFLFLCYMKQIQSMLPFVCSVIDHRRRQDVVRTSVTHSAVAFCDTFRRHLWSITVQMHGNMELLSVELYLNPVNPKWPYKATWRTMILISTVSLENQRKMTCPASGAYPEKKVTSWMLRPKLFQRVERLLKSQENGFRELPKVVSCFLMSCDAKIAKPNKKLWQQVLGQLNSRLTHVKNCIEKTGTKNKR